VATPHIGARTIEAQARIATETARMVVAALAGSLAVSAVNLPFAAVGRRGEPYLRLGERLGWLAAALLPGSLRRVAVELRDVEAALAVPAGIAVLKGALTPLLGEGVNYVNVRHVARQRAIGLACSEPPPLADDPRRLTVTVASDGAEIEIGGALGADGEPRVVRWCGYPLELSPAGRLLAIESRDVPGVIGRVATLLGGSGVNIAQIHLAQRQAGGALAVLRLDQEPEESLRAALSALPEVRRAQYVELAAIDEG
jgi:D-3-phosphoglycerate dehydrogenase